MRSKTVLTLYQYKTLAGNHFKYVLYFTRRQQVYQAKVGVNYTCAETYNWKKKSLWIIPW